MLLECALTRMKHLFVIFAVFWGTVSLSSADMSQAETLRLSGKFKQAAAEYHKVLGSKIDSISWPSAKFMLAQCSVGDRNYKQAVRQFGELINEFPSDPLAPEAAWNVIQLKCGPLQDRKGALAMARQLADWRPTGPYNERGLYSQALIFFWDKRPKQAKEALLAYQQTYATGVYTEAVKQLLVKL